MDFGLKHVLCVSLATTCRLWIVVYYEIVLEVQKKVKKIVVKANKTNARNSLQKSKISAIHLAYKS